MLWGRMLRRTARTEEQRSAYTGWAQGATELEGALRDQVRGGASLADSAHEGAVFVPVRGGHDLGSRGVGDRT